MAVLACSSRQLAFATLSPISSSSRCYLYQLESISIGIHNTHIIRILYALVVTPFQVPLFLVCQFSLSPSTHLSSLARLLFDGFIGGSLFLFLPIRRQLWLLRLPLLTRSLPSMRHQHQQQQHQPKPSYLLFHSLTQPEGFGDEK